MERFTLTSGENLQWTVADAETKISITFREGLYNETQQVNLPENLSEDQTLHLHTTMREFGDWMAQNHSELCLCTPGARCRAIYTLCQERYWLAMADAMKSLIIDCPDDSYPELLLAEMEDYVSLENGIGLNEAEKTNLLGAISLLDDDEANEVINILYVFWTERHEADAEQWARDLLWWPAWCPQDKREEEIVHDED